MKKFISIFTILILGVSFAPSIVLANSDFFVAVDHPLLRIQAKRGITVDTPLTLSNKADSPVTLRIDYRQFVPSQTETRGIEYVATNPETKRVIGGTSVWEGDTPVPEITLAAKQKKTVRLHIIVLPDTKEQDYYYSVIFVSETPSPSSIEVNSSYLQVRGALASHILLSVGERNQPSVVNANLITSEISEAGPLPFTLLIRNTGKHFIRPSAVIVITNMFGQHVGRLTIPQKTILAGATQEVKTLWHEPILFGRYTATVTLSVPNDTERTAKTITFWAVPYKALGGVFLVMVVLSVIIVKVRRRLVA